MTLPRRVPPEPSAAAIEAALANEASRAGKFHYNERDKTLWRQCLQRWEIAEMLRAAYAVDASPPPVVTVAQLAALLQECPHLFNCEDFDQPYDLAATWLHAHLVPPEAP